MRGYIAAATYVSERTTHMAILSAFQSLGFTLGPGIQAALTPLECTDPTDGQGLTFDMYTVSGYCFNLNFFLLDNATYVHT
jgi:ceroid-lipofuscinosis MFS transporter 7